ncbi:MAG TPA: hypothetical protein VFK58_03525 [Sphingomicrobium sp.]|nr:hypothetical protein [Sphingomicrobium sp.]
MRMLTCTATAAIAIALAACNQPEPAANETAASEAEAAADLSALNGTWKADLSTMKFEGKPDEFLLQGGTYSCASCIPPLTVAADGQFHAVPDRPYFDAMSVKAVDDKTVEFRRRKGDKEVSRNTWTLSEDGNVLTNRFHDATTPNAPPVEGTTTLTRAGPAPAGAHGVSGKWMPEKIGDFSEEALKVTFRIDGNSVTSSIRGESYTAQIGGPAVAVQNDPGGTTVQVAREGANGLRETYTRQGKQVAVITIVPSADGRQITVVNTDPRDGSKSTWTANKAS